jgi:hypothetical protein
MQIGTCSKCGETLAVGFGQLATGPVRDRCTFACRTCGKLHAAPMSVTLVARLLSSLFAVGFMICLREYETFLPLTMALAFASTFPVTGVIHYLYFRGLEA